MRPQRRLVKEKIFDIIQAEFIPWLHHAPVWWSTSSFKVSEGWHLLGVCGVAPGNAALYLWKETATVVIIVSSVCSPNVVYVLFGCLVFHFTDRSWTLLLIWGLFLQMNRPLTWHRCKPGWPHQETIKWSPRIAQASETHWSWPDLGCGQQGESTNHQRSRRTRFFSSRQSKDPLHPAPALTHALPSAAQMEEIFDLGDKRELSHPAQKVGWHNAFTGDPGVRHFASEMTHFSCSSYHCPQQSSGP